MTPQLILDLQASEYHSRPEYSQSQIKLLPDHPKEFYVRYVRMPVESRWTFKTTPAMELGTTLHSVLLDKQPLKIIPQDVLSANGAKVGKKWKDYLAANIDNPGVNESETYTIRAMADACREDEVIRGILDNEGPVEATIIHRDEEFGIDLRHRLDKVVTLDDGYIVADLKTMSVDVTSEFEVAKQIYSFGYHKQAAAYSDAAEKVYGNPPKAFVLLCVETDIPFNAVAWSLSQDAINQGMFEFRTALQDLRTRLDSGNWSNGLSNKLNTIDLPDWVYRSNPEPVHVNPFSEFDGLDGTITTITVTQ